MHAAQMVNAAFCACGAQSHGQLQPPHFGAAGMGSCHAMPCASIAALRRRSPRWPCQSTPNRHVPIHLLPSEWLLRHLGLEATYFCLSGTGHLARQLCYLMPPVRKHMEMLVLCYGVSARGEQILPAEEL